MYTREDLVNFGNYLLSDLRKMRFQVPELHHLESERIDKVHDFDIANWRETEEEVNVIFASMKQEIRDQMLIDSIIPDLGGLP